MRTSRSSNSPPNDSTNLSLSNLPALSLSIANTKTSIGLFVISSFCVSDIEEPPNAIAVIPLDFQLNASISASHITTSFASMSYTLSNPYTSSLTGCPPSSYLNSLLPTFRYLMAANLPSICLQGSDIEFLLSEYPVSI